MNILKKFKNLLVCFVVMTFWGMPVLSLDLDSTVTDNNRSHYGVQTPQQNTNISGNEKVKLPVVPALPKNANSSTIAPINIQYSGKIPNEEAIIPCNIKVDKLTIDESIIKSKYADKNTILVKNETKKNTKISKNTTKTTNVQNYRTYTLAKGTQFRAANRIKITDSLLEGQTVEFLTTQEIVTPYCKIPKNTKLTAKVVDSHKPQISCNGGLVALRIVSAYINGYTQPINAGIVKIKTDNLHFSNLKGEHTYLKTVCKKAKWGQNMFNKWAKTSSELANKGAGVILAPFPYIGGCVLAVSSTVTSPVTAILGKGGNLSIPANTVFTIKMYDDAKIRY